MRTGDPLERKNCRIFLLKHPLKLFWFIFENAALLTDYGLFIMAKAFGRWFYVVKNRFIELRRTQDQPALSLERLPDIQLRPYEGSPPDVFDVKLATQNVRIEEGIDWHHPYTDQEDLFALNRFGWLLCVLMQYPEAKAAEFALKSILAWIRQVKKPEAGDPVWESYSVAERLANWPFILRIAQKLIPLPDDSCRIIAQSMKTQLTYLMNHLELNGRFTNNHILNDARGLYIGGVVLGDDAALKKSRHLFTFWTEKIFYPDGMIKDGSSHYQWLLSQRYEQVYFLSGHIKDGHFCAFMGKWTRLLLDARDFFSVYNKSGWWRMPMFGDISPDFSPNWLSCDSKTGWTLLKRWLNWRDLPVVSRDSNGCLEKKGDFLRLNSGKTVIFWHCSMDKNAVLNHGHYDSGSFVLFYEGEEIFADPGISSYNRAGLEAKNAKAHSSITVNSLGPVCEDRRLNLVNAYRLNHFRFTVSQTGSSLFMELQGEGFKRLPVPVQWRRKFAVDSDKMMITDFLKGPADDVVESRFQISPGLKTRKVKDAIDICLNEETVVRLKAMDSSDSSVEERWFSREYGKFLPGTTLLFRRPLHNNRCFVYEIHW